jgi:hypothetical protein
MFRMVMGLLLIGGAMTPALAQSGGPLEPFIGSWSCKGSFTANGSPIAADLSVQLDRRSGALIIHHDDVPPGAYHALEVWSVNKGGAGVRAAISDSYSGMRWFESPGWAGGPLILTRLENGAAAEQFAYAFKGEVMQIDWSVARGGAMQLGDTISCRRVP